MASNPRSTQVVQGFLDIAEDHNLSCEIFELSNIAGPMVSSQFLHRLVTE